MVQTTSRLIIFDVDGTLVDSQETIVAALTAAYGTEGIEVPDRAHLLSIVGLSLPQAFATLLPGSPPDRIERLVLAYKAAFLARREAGAGEGAAPLFPGARAAIERLHARGYRLAIATGKARRGVDHFLGGHGFGEYFSAIQTADDAPSKPHPGMVLNCLAATGTDPRDAVIVGDTEFDMAMGRAAGTRALGVVWGYHPQDRVTRGGAEALARDFDHLDQLIGDLWA